MYAIILNFRTGKIDAVSIPNDCDAESYIEETLEYSLTDCEWMVTDSLQVNFVS